MVYGQLGVNDLARRVQECAPEWQISLFSAKEIQEVKEVIQLSPSAGPVWIVHRKRYTGAVSHWGLLEDSDYSWHRETLGSIYQQARQLKLAELEIELQDLSPQAELGAYVGLELAAYSFKSVLAGSSHYEGPSLKLKTSGSDTKNQSLKERGAHLAHAVNLARHLVNTPPNWCHPESLSRWLVDSFKGSKVKVQVWSEERLRREGMGLHLGVGQGADSRPCMVKLSYRPKVKAKQRFAFVGKGITFDTGGLDIKPSSAMRLMKKDMGGAASLVGLAQWLTSGECEAAVDIYLGLAENSVDSRSMRPSDILVARNGMTVEIHNTDAEGRLVLADVLDVAVTEKDPIPLTAVVDVATLTGAIKVALGAEIAGLFANHDGLADLISRSAVAAGESCWRMPLPLKYTAGMQTPFADVVNAVDGFGGAITAALFLEKFVRQLPWAHLDIYAWNDKPTGALSFSGGSGQAVQMLVHLLNFSEEVSI